MIGIPLACNLGNFILGSLEEKLDVPSGRHPIVFESGRKMISVLVGCSVAAENLQEALTVYGELVAATLKEPGCVSYELLQLRNNPCELMLAERWLSQEYLDAHTRTAHFVEAMNKLETLETATPAMIYTRAV